VLGAAGFTLDLSEAFSFNYFTLFSALAAYLFLRRIVGSPLGAVLVGIRENERRMRSMGFPVRKFKLFSFVLSSLLAGVSGSLYAFFNGFVSPQELYWPTSATVLIMVVLGGAGTLAGPALGAAFVLAFQSAVSSYSERWPMFLGAVFASFVVFAREGLAGLARRQLEGVDWKR
jgi:branched-chain amino acid transport system permease protein